MQTYFNMTYTLTGIDRFECGRTRQAKFKPQKGLTKSDLNKISKREIAKLYAKYPEWDVTKKRNNLDVMLVYVEEQITPNPKIKRVTVRKPTKQMIDLH